MIYVFANKVTRSIYYGLLSNHAITISNEMQQIASHSREYED